MEVMLRIKKENKISPLSNVMAKIVIFIIIFGAHMNILIIIKVKILVLINWSYRSPQLC